MDHPDKYTWCFSWSPISTYKHLDFYLFYISTDRYKRQKTGPPFLTHVLETVVFTLVSQYLHCTGGKREESHYKERFNIVPTEWPTAFTDVTKYTLSIPCKMEKRMRAKVTKPMKSRGPEESFRKTTPIRSKKLYCKIAFILRIYLTRKVNLSSKNCNIIFRKWGGGSKVVWNFSENSSVLVGGGFP